MVRYGGTMPSERSPFTPSSILFRPHQQLTGLALFFKPDVLLTICLKLFGPRFSGLWAVGGGAGYRPRVRMVYSDVHLSP